MTRERAQYGSTNGAAKLNEAIVAAMRRRYRRCSHRDGVAALARDFGVSYNAAWSAVHLATWPHVREPMQEQAPQRFTVTVEALQRALRLGVPDGLFNTDRGGGGPLDDRKRAEYLLGLAQDLTRAKDPK